MDNEFHGKTKNKKTSEAPTLVRILNPTKIVGFILD
jgi:hypothetical protein